MIRDVVGPVVRTTVRMARDIFRLGGYAPIPVAAPEVISSGTSVPGLGTNRTIPIPAGAAEGDRVVTLFEAGNAVVSLDDNQLTGYTALVATDALANQVVYISDPFGATIPTTITVEFSGGTFLGKADAFVVRGATATIVDQGIITSGFAVGERTFPYTTTTDNQIALGWVSFTGGGVTATTSTDAAHTWLVSPDGGYNNTFCGVRDTAGAYTASAGPVGSGSAGAGFWFTLAGGGGGGGGGGEVPVAGLTHSMTLEYVDASGVKQTQTATPGSALAITLPLGSPMFMDATDSRSTETNADTEGEAWTALGHRFDSGEALAGTWSLTGANKNVVTGAGVVGQVYTTAGTFTLSHWVRDSAARQSLITVSVTVPALAAGTTIATGGSWPIWASNTVYNLAAGTDHTAKGDIDLSGLHNVVIRKTGAGADPLVSNVRWHTVNISGTAQSRTRGCRLIGIDAASVNESAVGSLYCAIVGGRARYYETSADEYFWENEAVGQIQKDNIKRVRGLALWDCGVVGSNSTNYVLIFSAKNFIARNVDFNKTTGDTGQHVFRGWFDGLDLRLNRFRSAVTFMSYNKITGADNGATLDAWPADDTLGLWNGSLNRPVCRKIVLNGNIYGASGSNNTTGTNVEIMPENDVGASPDQAIELVSMEGNQWFVPTFSGVDNGFSGRHYQYFNNKVNLGAGAEVPYATDVRLNRTPAGWEGPYVNSARPDVVI